MTGIRSLSFSRCVRPRPRRSSSLASEISGSNDPIDDRVDDRWEREWREGVADELIVARKRAICWSDIIESPVEPTPRRPVLLPWRKETTVIQRAPLAHSIVPKQSI